MKVNLSKHAGFCPGVKRADLTIQKLINENSDKKIYTLGHLIHNRLYNEALQEKGVKSISFSEVDEVLKSHKKDEMVNTP